MVDAADRSRIKESANELQELMGMEELKDVPFVVFGNKIDVKDAMSEDELREAMNLHYHSTYGKDKNN